MSTTGYPIDLAISTASSESFAMSKDGVVIPIEFISAFASGSRRGLFRLRALFTISRAFSIIFCNSGLDT